MGQDLEALGEWIAEQAAHMDAATHRLLTAVREFDREGGWYAQGATSCAEWLSWRVGWSNNTARDRVRVAQRLGEFPLVDEALRRGELSYCKVRAITRVATPANEAALVDMARSSTGAQLDQICRKYAAVKRQGAVADPRNDADERYLTRRDLDNGFVEIRARLHPEEAAAVWAALDQIVKERYRPPATMSRAPANVSAEATVPTDAMEVDAATTDPVGAAGSTDSAEATLPGSASQYQSLSAVGDATVNEGTRQGFRFGRIDALIELAQGVLHGDRPDRAPVELVVSVAAEVLRDPTNAPDPIGCLSDGTCVSAETIRRLSCDCGVVLMGEDAEGRPLSVGRKTRSIPGAIKRALLRRDRHCRFPGCQNRLFVEGHHIEHWADGGDTALGNLVSMCSHHHRFVHEYGYRVELDAEHIPRFFDERGRQVVDAPAQAWSDQRGWPTVARQNAALGLGAETPACGWDGEPVDYDWVIDALVSVDRDRTTAEDDDLN